MLMFGKVGLWSNRYRNVDVKWEWEKCLRLWLVVGILTLRSGGVGVEERRMA